MVGFPDQFALVPIECPCFLFLSNCHGFWSDRLNCLRLLIVKNRSTSPLVLQSVSLVALAHVETSDKDDHAQSHLMSHHYPSKLNEIPGHRHHRLMVSIRSETAAVRHVRTAAFFKTADWQPNSPQSGKPRCSTRLATRKGQLSVFALLGRRAERFRTWASKASKPLGNDLVGSRSASPRRTELRTHLR